MIRLVVVTGALILLSLPSFAQSEKSGWYAGAAGGLTIVEDSDLSASSAGVPITGSLDFDPGFNIGAQVGYKFPQGWRPELEYRYARATTDTVTLSAVGTTLSSGTDDSADAHQFFGNLWYDWDLKNRWMPYLGGGVAAVHLDVAGETDTVFGGQVGAGIQYAVSPTIVLDAGYRYVITTDPSFDSGVAGVSDIDAEYSSHNFLVGVRGHF